MSRIEDNVFGGRNFGINRSWYGIVVRDGGGEGQERTGVGVVTQTPVEANSTSGDWLESPWVSARGRSRQGHEMLIYVIEPRTALRLVKDNMLRVSVAEGTGELHLKSGFGSRCYVNSGEVSCRVSREETFTHKTGEQQR